MIIKYNINGHCIHTNVVLTYRLLRLQGFLDSRNKYLKYTI